MRTSQDARVQRRTFVAAAAATAGRVVGFIAQLVRLPFRLESPPLTRELRVRARNDWTFTLMAVYVSGLSVFAIAVVADAYPTAGRMWGSPARVTELAQRLFLDLAQAQLVIALMLAPALTCGSVTREWEGGTFESLALTTVSGSNIVLGKLAASLCYLCLLIFCSLPIVGITFMLGGVPRQWVVLSYSATASGALFFGALGLLSSTICRRTYASAALAYGGMIAAVLGIWGTATYWIGFALLSAAAIAALAIAAARWFMLRSRWGWIRRWSVYVGVMGIWYFAALTPLTAAGSPAATQRIRGVIADAHPLSLVFAPTERGAQVFCYVALVGAVIAARAAISVFRRIRRPRPDSLAVRARVARELGRRALAGEKAL